MSKTKIKKSRNAHEKQKFSTSEKEGKPPPPPFQKSKTSMQKLIVHPNFYKFLNQVLTSFKKVIKLISKAKSEHETFRQLNVEMQLNYEQLKF